jgi:glycine oxidase
MAHPEVIIVGGGVIGASCARSLSARGVSTTLLDPGPEPGAATPAAAGMLAPFAEAQPEDPFLSFCVRARDLYTELAAELRDQTGIDIGLWNEGILQVALTEDEVAPLKGAVTWRRQGGFAVDWLSIDEIRRLVPGIGPDAMGGAYAPEDGALDPSALRTALLESARGNGADIRSERVERLLFDGEQVSGVRTADGVRSAGAVILAAGAWSPRLGGVPGPLPVEPVRGQLAALAWPTGERPNIVYAGGGYVLARQGEAIAGSTMERVGFTAETTEDGIASVLLTARRIYPALDGALVTRSWAGLRPVTPDGRPILGPDPVIRNLWYATGHGRNGILLAGMTGDVIARLFTGEEVEYDLSEVGPGRFRRP